MIHVCFGLHDKTGRYSKFTGTTILSLFENTSADVTVHIIHDNTLTQNNRDNFIYLAGRYGQAVKFYNVEELCSNELDKFFRLIPYMKSARTTIGTFYKFLIMYALPQEIEKVIYLDADIVVNLDINELWQIDIGDRPLGAVPIFLQNKEKSDGIRRMMTKGFDLPRLGFVKAEDYFNAGVFIMNLKILRNEEEKIFKGMKFRGEHPEFLMFDQCIWNYCFSAQALKLPAKFNREVMEVRTQDGGNVERKIYHFTANNSFWSFGLDMNDPFNRLWMDYFIKSPWFDSLSIGQLYESLRQRDLDLKRDFNHLLLTMNGRARVFIIPEQDLNILLENFFVGNDEEIIFLKDGFSLNEVIDIITAYRHEKVFFIMLPNFPFHFLQKAGLVEYRDFIDACKFLLDSHSFIYKM